MIAIDTSALMAIALNEPDGHLHLARLRQAKRALLSTVTAVEARMVTYGRLGPRGVVLLDDLLATPVFHIVPTGPAEMEAAFNAFVAYGKGSGHPAGLNFGDVFSYALAKSRHLPLLFKGEDFSRTDVVPAMANPQPNRH